ncbi:MAG: hypothetical protein ABEJ98_00130 [Candidatus Nanohaloarchaea archaeon]
MALNALVSLVYGTVVESWALAVFGSKFFLAGVLAYSGFTGQDFRELLEDWSEYFVAALVVAGLGFSLANISAPSGGVLSELVALGYFLFLFWNY